MQTATRESLVTGTTLSAMQVLLCLALRQRGGPVSPRRLAARLGLSPTYLAKVTATLTRHGFLRANRGVHGGIMLLRTPENITLLDVVQVCQRRAVPAATAAEENGHRSCPLQTALSEAARSFSRVLGRWTLADVIRAHEPHDGEAHEATCFYCVAASAATHLDSDRFNRERG